MAVFYVLPPRTLLGECLAKLLRPYVPGVSITSADCAHLLESLVVGSNQEAFVIHREDLPEGEEPAAILRAGFGAEPGDQIVNVSMGPRDTEPRVRIATLGAL